MGELIRKLSIVSRGLKRKLIIAFSLMSVIPLLVCLAYIIPDLVPNGVVDAILKEHVRMIFFLACILAVMGFVVIKGIIDPVIKISSDVAKIASGDYAHAIYNVREEDEVGDLSAALNKLTLHIRENMNELRNYSEKTQEINLEINKRVIILSGLLQISELISKEVPLGDVLEIIIEKAIQLGDSTLSFLCLKDEFSSKFFMKSVYGPKSGDLRRKGLNEISLESRHGFLESVVKSREFFICDKRTVLSEEIERFQREFSLVNFLALPIVSRSETVGILVIGNDEEEFSYSPSDLELIDIFSKQVGIAIENDFLIHRIKKLEVKDALTGLYNESFIRNRLNEEIQRAISFQRPCSFVMLDIDNFGNYRSRFGDIATEAVLKKISLVLQDSVTEVDRGARFADSAFAIVFPEKNKRESLRYTEEIRRKIEFIFSEEPDQNKKITVTGVVVENPIDGVTSEDLINKARETLLKRQENIRNRILS